MSQIILDDQLFDVEVLIPLARWTTVARLRSLRPSEVIKDERVPLLLRSLRQPTFLTIDAGFWDRKLCDPKYSILFFALTHEQQDEIPELLRRVFRLDEFKTRNARMGKVARISTIGIEFWQIGDEKMYRLNFK